jgi:hypothetical protein
VLLTRKCACQTPLRLEIDAQHVRNLGPVINDYRSDVLGTAAAHKTPTRYPNLKPVRRPNHSPITRCQMPRVTHEQCTNLLVWRAIWQVHKWWNVQNNTGKIFKFPWIEFRSIRPIEPGAELLWD